MNIDPNLVLVKSITVTLLNRFLENKSRRVDSIVEEVTDGVVPQNMSILGEGGEGEATEALQLTLDWIKNAPKETLVLCSDVVSRVKLNCAFNEDYIECITDLIPDDVEKMDQEELEKRVNSILSELRYDLEGKRLGQLFRKGNKAINNGSTNFNARAYVQEFMEELKDHAVGDGEFSKPGFVGRLSTDDEESIVKVLENSKQLVSNEGLLKFPLNGLTKALGGTGFRRGESICFKARSHHYKSGNLLDCTKWLPMYNVPHMFDEKKKPLILRISFENTLEQDINQLYRSIFEFEKQEKIDMAEVNTEEAAKAIIEKLGQRGYTVAIECYDPNNFTVWDLVELITYYESLGYEIHVCIVDYIEKIAKGNGKLRDDQAIINAFQIMRNHCNPRRTTFITAHQLSTESGKLLAECGTATFSSKIVDSGGIYDRNCRSLITELDLEIVTHIHKVGDDKFLTYSKGKHRDVNDVSQKHLNFAYKFQKFGGICPDSSEFPCELYSFSDGDSNNNMSDSDW